MNNSLPNQGHAAGPSPATPNSVLERTAIGTGWIICWRMATRVLGLLNTLVLIRLLAPGDFGVVALGTTFALAVDTLSVLGVEDSLVREAHPTPAMYNTAFTLTLIRGLVTSVLILGAALPVAAFFAEPRLAEVLWALAAMTVIGAAGSIGVVDFRREMDFRKEFLLQIVPRLLSIMVTVGAALVWRSYWALIAGMLAGRVTRTLFSYQMHPWRPHLTLRAWRYLFGFSAWAWAISMAELVRDRMDAFVIGRTLDAGAVGIYAIGEEIALLPTTELVFPLCRSCFSGFAAARAAGHDMAEAYMRPVAFAFMVTFPAGLGLSLVADPLVRLTVGEKWVAAIPVIQVMGVMGSMVVFGIVSSTLLAAHGMLQRQLGITLAAVAVRLGLIIPLITRFGILGAAIGAFAAMILEHSLFVATAFRRFGLCPVDLVRRVWRPAAAAAAMAAVLAGTGMGWAAVPGDAGHVALVLIGSASLGVGAYGSVLLALWSLSGRSAGAEADAVEMTRRLVRRLVARLVLTHPKLKAVEQGGLDV